MVAVTIVAIIFGSIVSLFLVPTIMRSREREKLQDTLKAAIEAGQSLPADVITALSSNVKVRMPASPERDLRVGIIWSGVAAGLTGLAIALSFDEPDATYPLLGLACFPGFIGLAFILMAYLNRNRKS
ncbi:MAG: hypothetical protein CFE28_08990 [Alphaproteobacteria bacterium PA2]|nr:MAG: hypothetical protein CFE28_08990 [Alphaproteobacteria bacterium PA2]